MPEIGQFRIVLDPDTDPAYLEAQVRNSPPQMKLTRITSRFEHRLLRSTERAADGTVLGREYIYEVTVWLVSNRAGYLWDENIDAVAQSVAGLATVTGVESFTPVIEAETEQ